MKNLLTISILLLGGIAAGCGWDQGTAPQPQDSAWQLVRFHASSEQSGDDATAAGFVDLSVQSDGEVTLVDGRGEAASSRGLLAGERLETLARLVDALPPQSYSPSSPCGTNGFFVSLTRGGEVYTYASGACDPSTPGYLSSFEEYMSGLVSMIGSERAHTVAFRVLSEGPVSAIQDARRIIIRDRDALAALLQEHSPNRPVILPRIDFARQVVVAEYLGSRPSAGYWVTAVGAEVNDGGMLRVTLEKGEPAPGCAAGASETSPFVLIAVEYHGEDLVFETIRKQSCPSSVASAPVENGQGGL